MEKWEKNHLFWKFSRGGTGTEQSVTGTISVLSPGTRTGTGTQCSILTSVRILAITCSFIIRIEFFKYLIKLDFKENKTP